MNRLSLRSGRALLFCVAWGAFGAHAMTACSSGSSSSGGGGDGGGGGGGGGSATFCADLAARAASCDAGAVDPTKCDAQKTCYDNIVRTDAIGPLETCLTTRACGKSDDSCLVEASAQFVNAGPYQKFQDDCLAKRTSCTSEGASFADDNCSSAQAALFTEAAFGAVQACLDRPCAEIEGCFTDTFAAAGCN